MKWGLEDAPLRGLVDLWPIMTDLPDRRRRVHITRPWLHASHSLVPRAGSVTPDPDITGNIALFKLPIHVDAVVKGIVRSQGGTINVVRLGLGSRFEILPPCSSEPARERPDETVTSAAGEVASCGTVLVVEDEDALRLAVSRMLRRNGFTVVEAANRTAG